ncbi:hypothetical protein VNO77_19121 [Canavalia gladiata]|uniref:Uncharacterized protein n=1 Tax=Canavalia gladiata TaxID=3824 RepID=A0AAN9QK83_CANGL
MIDEKEGQEDQRGRLLIQDRRTGTHTARVARKVSYSSLDQEPPPFSFLEWPNAEWHLRDPTRVYPSKIMSFLTATCVVHAPQLGVLE